MSLPLADVSDVSSRVGGNAVAAVTLYFSLLPGAGQWSVLRSPFLHGGAVHYSKIVYSFARLMVVMIVSALSIH